MQKISLGVTASPILFTFLATGAVAETALIDYIKADGDIGLVGVQAALAYRPVLLHDINNHVWLNYANPFDAAAMAQARTLLDSAQSPWFSTGIGASAEPQGHTLPFWRGAEPSALQSRTEVIANITRNGRQLQTWLGETPLLLENYNYHPTNAYEYVCEPETFSALIQAVDCGVLLDLAHAQISAHNLGWRDVYTYLQALPLDRVREIHINQPFYDPNMGQMLDRHLPITRDDLDLLRWTLAHTPAEAVTLESESPDVDTLRQEVALLRQALDGGSLLVGMRL